MRDNQDTEKTSMEVGDKVLVNLVSCEEVMIIARVDVPHATELAFATRSGGRYTIGRKIWKMDYRWDSETKMWMRKS
jgi:hypothetical protein